MRHHQNKIDMKQRQHFSVPDGNPIPWAPIHRQYLASIHVTARLADLRKLRICKAFFMIKCTLLTCTPFV